MKLSTLITSTAMALVISAGAAFAQATPTAPSSTLPKPAAPSTTVAPSPTATPSVKPVTRTTKVKKALKAGKARSEASLACSSEATAKNLHGKERKTFRKKCIAGKAKN
jgi:psiF repeat